MVKRSKFKFDVIVTLKGEVITDQEIHESAFWIEQELNEKCAVIQIPTTKAYCRFHAIERVSKLIE